MAKTINDLREVLFSALAGLSSKDAPMDIDRAKAISEVAQTIINSAKVEVDFMRVSGADSSGFLESKKELGNGIVSTTVHRIK